MFVGVVHITGAAPSVFGSIKFALCFGIQKGAILNWEEKFAIFHGKLLLSLLEAHQIQSIEPLKVMSMRDFGGDTLSPSIFC